ncbi:MAG: sugar ABC transporter permease, partial [Firmicutes bacterium]|nr:sugar ABC transporter permease [Bacillota bacterium]
MVLGEYDGRKKSNQWWHKIWRGIEPYLFIAPCILMIFAFNFYTFFYGARLSLTNAQGINPGEFIGLANFKELLFENVDFWPSIKRTILFTLGCLFTQMPAALILAVILNSITSRIRGLLRASFYVPVLINTVVAALIFRMPSIVCTAESANSGSPVARVNVSASKIRSSGANPYSPQAIATAGHLQQAAAMALAASPIRAGTVYVGGPTALQGAMNALASQDFSWTMSLVFAAIFILLVAMLRS